MRLARQNTVVMGAVLWLDQELLWAAGLAQVEHMDKGLRWSELDSR